MTIDTKEVLRKQLHCQDNLSVPALWTDKSREHWTNKQAWLVF